MKQLKINILTIGLFVSLSYLVAEEVPIVIEDAVILETYEGVGSVLLSWSVPAGLEIRSTIISRTYDLFTPFEILTQLDTSTQRYNDITGEESDLYFYRVELVAIDGLVYSSSSETPPFTRVLSYTESNLSPDELHVIPQLKSFNAVMAHIIQEILREKELNIDSTSIQRFSATMLSDTINPYFWVESIPLHELPVFAEILEKDFIKAFIVSTRLKLNEIEVFIRNSLLKTPDEWDIEVNDIVDHLDRQLAWMGETYFKNLDYLERITPISMIQQTTTGNDSTGVVLLVIDPMQLQQDELYLISNDEYIDIELPDEYPPGTVIKITIPSEWRTVDLVNGEDVLQSVPIQYSGNILITLENEYCLVDKFQGSTIRAMLGKQEAWLNEIIYFADTRRLAIEVATTGNSLAKYALFNGDSLLWDIDPVISFQTSYLDSSWTITDSTQEVFWLHLKKRTDKLEWITVESRPVYYNRDLMEGRLSDRESWHNISTPTLGRSNDQSNNYSNRLNIPEVFALYQNYPNPFNASTTITFDLLKPATVSLFVSDARGRIIDQFLENTKMETGIYQYQWFGEHRSSGVYFFTIKAKVGDYFPVVYSRKMIYLK